MLQKIKNKVCHAIFLNISNIVYKCRSPEYDDVMKKAFLAGVEVRRKADEYVKAKIEKEELLKATMAFKEHTDISFDKLGSKLEILEEENEIMRTQIETLCLTYLARDYEKVAKIIEMLAEDMGLGYSGKEPLAKKTPNEVRGNHAE